MVSGSAPTKIWRKRSLGIAGRWKLIAQVLIAIGLWYVATERAGLNDVVLVRIFDASIDFGWLMPVFIFFVLAGATNGVNLTDGLDGLAAGCAAIVFITVSALRTGRRATPVQRSNHHRCNVIDLARHAGASPPGET